MRMLQPIDMLLLLGVGAPLLLALLFPFTARRSLVARLAPLAPLPALIVALVAAPGTVAEVPLLLGMQLGLTATTQLFLLFRLRFGCWRACMPRPTWAWTARPGTFLRSIW
jgi:hypothetical protein